MTQPGMLLKMSQLVGGDYLGKYDPNMNIDAIQSATQDLLGVDMKNYIKIKFLAMLFGAGNILDTTSTQFPNITTYKNLMDGIVNDMISSPAEGSASTWLNGTGKDKLPALY
jgi:hypothetical protein